MAIYKSMLIYSILCVVKLILTLLLTLVYCFKVQPLL